MTGRDLFGVVIRVIGFCLAAMGLGQLVQVAVALSSGMPASAGLAGALVTPVVIVLVGVVLMRFAEAVVRFAYGKT
jgi:uncharacterized membrane protein YidH (DUF202 family)